MMAYTAMLLVLFQAQPAVSAATTSTELPNECTTTQVVLQNAPAPCSGLLWSTAQSREAALCAQVRVPQIEADLKRIKDIAQIQHNQNERNTVFRDNVIQQLLEQRAKSEDTQVVDLLFAYSLGLATGVVVVVLVK